MGVRGPRTIEEWIYLLTYLLTIPRIKAKKKTILTSTGSCFISTTSNGAVSTTFVTFESSAILKHHHHNNTITSLISSASFYDNLDKSVKVKSTMLHKRAWVGAHIPLPGLEPIDEPLLSVTHGQCDARPTVTFPAARHHRPLAGTKLCCLVTEAHVC